MVAGYDRYFQIVRCFRDEDLRADRQPEFTQIDCEMSFVEREDVLNMFEGLAKRLFKNILGKEFDGNFPRIGWHEAMDKYGSDKPDIRFGMTFNDITEAAQGKGFGVLDSAEYVGAICAEGCAGYTRKQLDELTEFVKRPQVGAKGMVYVRCEADGSYKSSVDKFYRTARPREMGGAVRRQSGRPAADPQRAAQKNADRPVRIAPRNGQSAGTAVAREVRAAVGSRFPAARMGRPDAAFLRDAPPVHVAESRRHRPVRHRSGKNPGQRLRLRRQRRGSRRRVDPYLRCRTAAQRCSKRSALRTKRRRTSSDS